jgi:hypothetical protein
MWRRGTSSSRWLTNVLALAAHWGPVAEASVLRGSGRVDIGDDAYAKWL